jgi:hypothetical protein
MKHSRKAAAAVNLVTLKISPVIDICYTLSITPAVSENKPQTASFRRFGQGAIGQGDILQLREGDNDRLRPVRVRGYLIWRKGEHQAFFSNVPVFVVVRGRLCPVLEDVLCEPAVLARFRIGSRLQVGGCQFSYGVEIFAARFEKVGELQPPSGL